MKQREVIFLQNYSEEIMYLEFVIFYVPLKVRTNDSAQLMKYSTKVHVKFLIKALSRILTRK